MKEKNSIKFTTSWQQAVFFHLHGHTNWEPRGNILERMKTNQKEKQTRERERARFSVNRNNQNNFISTHWLGAHRVFDAMNLDLWAKGSVNVCVWVCSGILFSTARRTCNICCCSHFVRIHQYTIPQSTLHTLWLGIRERELIYMATCAIKYPWLITHNRCHHFTEANTFLRSLDFAKRTALLALTPNR